MGRIRSATDDMLRNRAGIDLLGASFRGLVAGFAVDKLIGAFTAANREIASFGETAKKAVIDVERFQALRLAAQGKGIDGKEFDSGLTGLAKELNGAKREENDLTRLLDANNIKFKDRRGQVISTNEALAIAADLISRTRDEQDKIAIAEKFGLPPEFVRLLEGGAAAMEKLAREAANAGTILDADVIQKAADFDRAWANGWSTFAINAKAAILTAGQGLAGLIAQAGEYLGKVNAANRAKGISYQEELAERTNRAREQGTANAGGRAALDAERAAEGRQRRANFRHSEIDYANQWRDTPQPPSRPAGIGTAEPKIPKAGAPAKGAKGPKSDEDKAQEKLDRYIESLMRQNSVLDAEIATFGKSNAEKRAAVELAKAQVDLAKLDEGERQKVIDSLRKEIELSEQKRTVLDNLKKSQEGLRDAQRFVGDAIVDSFEDMILNGEKADKVVQNLTRSLARAALQAALMGSGPLAGLFGTAGANGATGGLFGLLGSLIPGRAMGGPVRAGQPYIVGEKRPELFVPNSSGRIVPRIPNTPADLGRNRPGSTVSYTDGRVINITPANGVTPEQMTAALAAYDRQARRNITATLRNATARY